MIRPPPRSTLFPSPPLSRSLWGDRLLDGKLTGLGEWEASRNDTHAAVDLIPKDVVICDWHYARADQTAVYFAMKGLDVVSCSRSEEHTSELQSRQYLVCRLL